MVRCALLVAVALTLSCKKQPPAGDLPPAAEAPAAPAPGAPAAATPGPAAPTPPAAQPGNPHAGMGDDPSKFAATPKPPKTLEPLPDGRLAMGPFTLVPPPGWTAKPIKSSMRAADFAVPGGKPDADAELIVTYFGPGGAGGVDDNINRWLGQFMQPDGKSTRSVAKIDKAKFADQDATVVQVGGRFVTTAMPGVPGGGRPLDKADYAMLAAIVGSPTGPYYFKLTGPKATIDGNAKAFRAMLDSLKLR